MQVINTNALVENILVNSCMRRPLALVAEANAELERLLPQ